MAKRERATEKIKEREVRISRRWAGGGVQATSWKGSEDGCDASRPPKQPRLCAEMRRRRRWRADEGSERVYASDGSRSRR